MNTKLGHLESILNDLGSTLIAYSGGVDSTFLAFIAHKVLGKKAVAVTAISPIHPESETESARAIAQEIGIRHILLETKELGDPSFVSNDTSRCYYCKKGIFTELLRIASEEGLGWVIDGSNYDDTSDNRPGMIAAAELGVRSPLIEAGLGKKDIRSLSHEFGLSTWDKPSLSCLATRIPYGTPITVDLLRRISEAEDYLYSLGLREVRVRHHGPIARIEVPSSSMGLLIEEKKRVVERLHALGYTCITLDLEGLR